MKKQLYFLILALIMVFLFTGCAKNQPPLTIETESAVPGTQVAKQGQKIGLTGSGISVGEPLPDTSLVDAKTMKPVNLSDYRGSVLLLSIVPSIDTKVCEAQTHYLGEEGDNLPPEVRRITISRDTPFAQSRFAKEAKLEDINYLSDYKEGGFGRSVGLLLEGPRLLARSVILVDKKGIVQYIQVVPEITHLPDMEEAFKRATALAAQP